PTERNGAPQLLVVGRYACYAALAILIAGIGLRTWLGKLMSLQAAFPLAAVCLFWAVSSIWSPAPLEGLIRATLLLVTFFSAVSIGCSDDATAAYSSIIGALSFFVLASFFVCLFFPAIGLDSS